MLYVRGQTLLVNEVVSVEGAVVATLYAGIYTTANSTFEKESPVLGRTFIRF